MADVSDRAQLIAVGALIVAVAFVSVGLVLNFVIFSENLATRDTNQEIRDVNQDRADAKTGVSRSMRYVNLNERSSITELTVGLTNETLALNEHFQRNSALAGTSTTVRLISMDLGTRLSHTNDSRAFRSAEDESSWVVAERIDPQVEVGPTNKRIPNPFYLEQTIVRGSLFNATGSTTKADVAANAYAIRIDEFNGVDSTSSGTLNRTWKVFVFRNEANNSTFLITDHPDETFGVNLETLDQFLDETCETRRTRPRMNLVEGTFGGQPCSELQFYPDDIDTSQETTRVDIAYERTDELVGQARGTYEVLIEENTPDNTSATPLDDKATNYDSLGGDSPFLHNALFASTINFTHASSTTEYQVEQIILPSTASRNNLPGFRPEFDVCTVKDNSGGGSAEYTFDWNVTDRDGNLKEVQFELFDQNDDVRRDNETVSVSGRTASDTDFPQLTDTGRDSSGDNYTTRMTAVDTAGNTNTLSVTDESDGTDPGGPSC